MDNPSKKKGKKSKVGPSEHPGAGNSSFELEVASSDVSKQQQSRSQLLNNVLSKFPKKKTNALSAITNARKGASKWLDFKNTKRKKRESTKRSKVPVAATGNFDEGKQTIRNLGLDDIRDDKKPIFGTKTSGKVPSAGTQALLQYFAKLGHSVKDDEVVDLDFVEGLLNGGADINCTDRHGQTLLHEVASKWHVDVAKFLIHHKADVNKSDNYGRTPLHVAAADDYPEMVNLLIENGAEKEARTRKEEQTPVHYAAKNDACNSLRALIKNDCEYKMIVDYKGRTPLHVAAELDRSETARHLLNYNAPAGVCDNKGSTVMSWMITKMPPVAHEALSQFHTTDRPNRKQYFYLNLLVPNREKDPHEYTVTPMQCAVRYKQYDLLTHTVFVHLLTVMWKKFAWWRAWGILILNFIYILLWTVLGVVVEYDERYLYKLPEDWWRIVLLVAAVGFTIWQLTEEVLEYRRSYTANENWKKWREKEIKEDEEFCHPRWPEEGNFLEKELEALEDYHTKYLSDYWNVFDWICYAFLLAALITHFVDIAAHTQVIARAHIRIMAVAIILLWLRIMKNARSFALLGPFIVMLGKMIGDLIRFAFLYLTFYIPFVCAFYMLFGGNKYAEADLDNPNRTESVQVDGFQQFNDAMFTMFRLTLVDEYDYPGMKAVDSIMADILVGAWLALSAILCLNLFIALLSDTFQRVYDNAQANAVMQRAITVLNLWDGMSDSAKNKFLDYIEKECAPMPDYYDDDMTEEGEEDLKKVTIQIKEQLDDMQEKWNEKFGDEVGGEEDSWSGGDDDDHDGHHGGGGGHRRGGGGGVAVERFESEIKDLRDSIQDVQDKQQKMMDRFKQDFKTIKTLLLDIAGGSNGGSVMGLDGHFGGFVDMDEAEGRPSQRSSSTQGKRKKKRSKTPDVMMDPSGAIIRGQSQGIFAAPPSQVEIATTEFSPATVPQLTQSSLPYDLEFQQPGGTIGSDSVRSTDA